MSFLLGFIPWWFWAGLALVAATAVVGLFKGDWKWGFGILAVGLFVALQSFTFRSGQEAEARKQKAADDHARDVIAANKTDVAGLPADERDKEFDTWSKR